MNRRRRGLVAALVLIPLVAFGVTRTILADDDDGSEAVATLAPTSTTSSTSTTTTTEAPTTTTAAAPKLGPGSPLPSVPQPGEPVAARSPEGLASQLTTAWSAISSSAPDLATQAHIYQVATRALSAKAELREPTYALLRGNTALEAQVRSDVDAAVKLRTLVGNPRTALPPWRIVQPEASDVLLTHYKAAEEQFGVPWYYLAAINLVESRMGRIRGTSEAGAQGPMQFLPATWSQYGAGGDINSYEDAIAAAARYLKRNGAPNDMRNAVFNYNHSQLYVDAVLAYGDRMKADESAFRNYYEWQVYYVTTAGDVWLPVGYGT